MRVIGLMSGTSMDSIDAALVKVQPSKRYKLEAEGSHPIPPSLRERLARQVERTVSWSASDLGALHHETALAFAEAARDIASCYPRARIDLIAVHGQTVAHTPKPEAGALRSTHQIADLNIIAHRTGVTTVGDFRWGHIAAGGEGAPLAPLFLQPLLADRKSPRVLLNLGGIANLTVLPPASTRLPARGFDTGPANALLDAVTQSLTGRPYDENGELARAGRVDDAALETMLADPFFKMPPPKSTGRDRFSLAWALNGFRRSKRLSAADYLATLAELSAVTVASAAREWMEPAPQVVYVSGGGVHNQFLMERLAARLDPTRIRPVESLGFSSDALEAVGMAVLGHRALLGHAWNIGGADARLGKIAPGENWAALVRKLVGRPTARSRRP